MTSATAIANLCHAPDTPKRKSSLLQRLLRFEAWLDRRAGGQTLYRMDDRALSDIGLSRADVARVDEETSWQNLLITPAGRR